MFTGIFNPIDTRIQEFFKIEALQHLRDFKIQLSSHKVGRFRNREFDMSPQLYLCLKQKPIQDILP